MPKNTPSTKSPKRSPPPIDRRFVIKAQRSEWPELCLALLKSLWERVSLARGQKTLFHNPLYHGLRMRARSILEFSVLPACLLGIAAGLVGCRSLPPSKPSSEWTPQEARGAVIYQAKCARCHYPTTTKPLNGPGLQALTKLKSMPSGAPPTDERLIVVIVHGRNMMPATPLTDDQLNDLLAYLHTL